MSTGVFAGGSRGVKCFKLQKRIKLAHFIFLPFFNLTSARQPNFPLLLKLSFIWDSKNQVQTTQGVPRNRTVGGEQF